MNADGARSAPRAGGDARELRLALVCYGGSSLAIYMHGVTKELHRLVKASALLDNGLEPAPGARSEAVYQDLLQTLAAREGLQTRVVVDIVAGTSAGGINGIYLSKAIAHNRSQDRLRDLWFECGDMRRLLLLPQRLPVKLRLFLLLPRSVRRSPLRGKEMAGWLHEALEAMDDEPPRPAQLQTLVPERGRLDLFVTITDFYGYDRQIPALDPVLVHDRRHRHALKFASGPGGEDDLGRDGNGALAFAARTTSCFPGVFPPVSLGAFREWVPEADLRSLTDRCFRSYSLAGASPEATQFVDGGVLDNKPFGWAIDSIVDRRADVEVERRLLYLEPDPGDRFLAPPGEVEPAKPAPTTLKAILSSVAGIPRHEPILDDLLELETHNERVARIRDVIETSFPGVTAFLETAEQLPADPESVPLAAWSKEINESAVTRAGLAYSTYLRLKISAVVDRYARTVCEVCDFPADSNHAQLVRRVLRCQAEQHGLFQKQPEPSDAQRDFLRDFDLDYGQRRLRFVISALRWWYRDLREGKPNIPPRSDLDRGKTILYDALDTLGRSMGGDDFTPELREQIADCFPDEAVRAFLADSGLDPVGYLAAHEPDLVAVEQQVREFIAGRLDGFSAGLYRDLFELSSDWPSERRRDLLVRYLGFPLWDVVLYPVQALAAAGENDQVDVQRLSPYEARVLRTPPQDKVQGKRLMHFWAFFDRTARENDYLWGRLDGAAHLVGILLGKEDPDYRSWCLRLFAAILDEEDQALPHIGDTVRSLRAELADGEAVKPPQAP